MGAGATGGRHGEPEATAMTMSLCSVRSNMSFFFVAHLRHKKKARPRHGLVVWRAAVLTVVRTHWQSSLARRAHELARVRAT